MIVFLGFLGFWGLGFHRYWWSKLLPGFFSDCSLFVVFTVIRAQTKALCAQRWMLLTLETIGFLGFWVFEVFEVLVF